MTDEPTTWPSDVRELQELFVDVTGEQTSTDAQAPDRGRGVVNTTDGDGPLRPEDVEASDDDAPLVDGVPGYHDDLIEGRPDDLSG